MAKSKEERNEDRMRRYYETERPALGEFTHCSICDGIIRRDTFTEKIGFHQSCDTAGWFKLYRQEFGHVTKPKHAAKHQGRDFLSRGF